MYKPVLLDESNYCDVLKHSLADDLLPFKLTNSSDDSVSLNYDASAGGLTSRYSILNSLAAASNQQTPLLDVWKPIFINTDEHINTKLLSSYGSYHNSNPNLKSCRLGIENFYSFTGHFKSFSNTANMSIDWIINNSNVPYYLSHGILCWYRYNNFVSNPYILGGKSIKIENFPNGARLTPSNNINKIYIKLSDTQLYDIDNPNKVFQNDAWTFNAEINNSIIEVSSLPSNVTFELANKDKNGENITVNNKLNPTFWIADGDCFFYYDNIEDVNLSATNNIPTKSYISSSLYKTYNLIYRIITLDEPRDIGPKNLRKFRLYRSLAHALSTSPFITDFSIKALDTPAIKALIQQYVNSAVFPTPVTSQTLLNTVLINISAQLQKTFSGATDDSLYLDTKFSKNTIHNNIIRKSSDLFYKLFQKYGAYANITSNTTFTAKTDVLKIDNRAISVFQISDHYCDKTLTNQTIYNNQTITFDNTIISTDFDQRKNVINLSNTNVPTSTGEIPLYNTARPSFNDGDNFSVFKPYLSYSGYVQRQYRQDDATYNPPVQPSQALNNEDNIYYSQVDLDAQTKLSSDPYATHISNLYELDPSLGGRFLGIPGLVNARNDDNGIELIATIINGVDRVKVIDNGVVVGIPNIYLENSMSFVWEQVGGRKGYFGSGKFEAGIGHLTQFYPRYTGKHIIKCTASTPFGSFIKYKTFYVVDGRDLNNPQYGKYWDEITKSWVVPPAITAEDINSPLRIDKDNILSNTIKFNKIAINNAAGVFVPVQTNCTIRKIIGDFAESASNQEDIIYNMGGESIFKFQNNFTLNNNPVLSIEYRPNNTITKVYSIWLERVRTDDPKCSQCLSMYYPRIKSVKNNIRVVNDDLGNATERSYNRIVRINKYPEGFTLKKYEYQEDRLGYGTVARVDFTYPQISNKFAPKIKNYGGYNRSFLDAIGIDINGLTKPATNTTAPAVANSLVSNTSTLLPDVTGYPLNEPNLIYMQKPISVDGSGLKIPFVKGILHPASGWISNSSSLYSANANKSAVLKFNPGARDSFSFIGPQLTRLKSNHASKSTNKIMPKIFSSTIALSISDGVRWECCQGTDAANQLHKNYADITVDPFNSSHGYRILHGGQPKREEYTMRDNTPIVNDEFETIQEADKSYYKFAVTGPFSTTAGQKNKRIPRINNLSIKDIEIKLNFLNYVNTKNLIVWLDVEYDKKETTARSTATDSPLKLRTKDFVNQTINEKVFFGQRYSHNQDDINIPNSQLNDYLKNLLQMNSISGLDNSTFKLVLLNQETIYNNGYNFSLKFSDHASKHNSLYEIVNSPNYYSAASGSEYSYLLNPIKSKQNIVQNNHEVLPTTAATGFSDREACYYSSVIKFNNLNIPNNTFNKFVSDSLFRNIATASCPSGSLDGETKFRLNIMVLDEEDDMTPLDNTINAQYLSEFETVKNIPKSSLISNSLCSWELILHTEKERDFVPETKPSLTSYGNNDVLSLIDYKKGLQYNGHSFIADLTSYKHLLPLANYNAPLCCISDENICLEPRNDPTGQTNMQRPPVFPNYAIIAILAGMAAIAGMGGAGIVGLLAGIAGINNDAAYKAIVDFLREASFSTVLQYEMRNVYIPNYGKYPFGSPEKILLNFKTPTSLWHTAEASIFKYHNTPILKNNQYKFIRLSKYNDFGKFKYEKVQSFRELIDTKFIKNVSGVTSTTTLNPPTSYNNVVINSGDILYNTTTSGLYIANSTALPVTTINGDTFENINKASLYISQNSVLSFGDSADRFWHNGIINSDISGNKMIIMSGRIPYDIFNRNDSVILMSGTGTTTSSANTISKKALILQDNTYNSVFVMSNPVPVGYDILCPNDQDSIFLTYKNETTIQDKIAYKYNIWGLNDTNKKINDTVELQPTCNSIGSYGDTSIFLEKNVLSDNIHANRLKDISEILNNHENDKIKHANITLFQPVNTGTINETLTNLTPAPFWTCNKTYGFSYSKDVFIKSLIYRPEKLNREVFVVTSGTDSEDKEKRIFANLQLSSAYNDIPKNISIIRTYYNQTLPISIQSGILEVEGDYYDHIPIKSITSSELTTLVSRLNTIKNTGVQPSLDNIVGNPNQTSAILASNNLKYISQHYEAISQDPVACYSRDNTSFTNCHKKNTFNKLQQLYQEEHDIVELISSQTVLINNIYTLRSTLPNTHPLVINNDILPKVAPVISGTGPISISYNKINENHYWINLDPNQGCFPDYEKNSRVLLKTKYRCSAANFGLFELPDANNNVCPQKAPKDIQGENMTFTHEIQGNVGHDYTYTMSEQYINQETNRIQSEYGAAISSWREITKTRFFNINGDQIFNNAGELPEHEEIVITAEETYKVPVPAYPSPEANTIDNMNLSGMDSCDGSAGSPAGNGLLVDSEAGRRVGKPITIAGTVNLYNQNDITVMIKKIPRMLRGMDQLSTVYRPGTINDYRQLTRVNPLIPLEIDYISSEGAINNSFYVWYALDIQNNQLRYAQQLPNFLKLQNEMTFRSFFGSVDRIENKTEIITPGYPWELIPFEYDNYAP